MQVNKRPEQFIYTDETGTYIAENRVWCDKCGKWINLYRAKRLLNSFLAQDKKGHYLSPLLESIYIIKGMTIY